MPKAPRASGARCRQGPQKTFVAFTRKVEKIKGGVANRAGVLRVRIETACRPTETLEAVSTALRNLFPDLRIESQEDRLTGTTESLERLRERIWEQPPRDLARRPVVLEGRDERRLGPLAKQSAEVRERILLAQEQLD